MPRILVVEDNAAVRYIVVRLLATAGYDVTETATAKDALQAWHEGGIDLVLTDVSLPDMNGFEMILQIGARAPGYPIIAMSGAGDRELLEVLHRTELDPVPILQKPFSPDALVNAIARVLKRPDQHRA